MVGPEDGMDGQTWTSNLSVNRAKAIYDYLIEQGIAASRLSYKGLGNTQPKRFPERTPLDEQANRRVEVRIVKK